MAESDSKPQLETAQESEQRLKYLDFVHVASVQVLIVFAALYKYAKENSGPLKPGVQTVEDNVKTVISPVYQKFRDVPFELLKFVDQKVESSVNELGSHVPPLVKSASSKAYTVAQKAPEVARSVASEVQRVGVVDTAADLAKTVYTKSEPTAKELYAKYEPVAEHYAVSGWKKLNQLPVFPQVAEVAVPTAAYCAEKYNETVVSTAKSGYTVSSYLPLVPIEKIAKVFGEKKAQET